MKDKLNTEYLEFTGSPIERMKLVDSIVDKLSPDLDEAITESIMKQFDNFASIEDHKFEGDDRVWV